MRQKIPQGMLWKTVQAGVGSRVQLVRVKPAARGAYEEAPAETSARVFELLSAGFPLAQAVTKTGPKVAPRVALGGAPESVSVPARAKLFQEEAGTRRASALFQQ